MLAPGDPLPDLGEALRELGGEERVGVDRRQLREQRLVVRNEPGWKDLTLIMSIFNLKLQLS